MHLSTPRPLRVFAFCALAFALPLAKAAAAEKAIGESDRTALSLTLYQNDLALIDESRTADLPAGTHHLLLNDLSEQLRPESLLLSGKGLQVIDQTFAYGLLSQQDLLVANIGKEVWWRQVNPASGEATLTQATLVSVNGGVLLQADGRVQTVSANDVVFNDLPPGLTARPTLTASVELSDEGAQEIGLQYLTGGMGWHLTYLAELNPSGNEMTVSALVTLANGTQADFRDATIRLVAGDVRQTQPQTAALDSFGGVQMRAEAVMADVPAQQASDRYLYTLPASQDLLSRQNKQVPLFTADDVKVTRLYRVEGLVNLPPRLQAPRSQQASLVLSLDNTAEDGLGRPLPAGAFMVYESLSSDEGGSSNQDGTGNSPFFAGASDIGHTAEGQSLEVILGRAFDVTAESKQTDFERLSKNTGSYEAAEQVTVTNAKAEAVAVEVIGYLPQGWKMLSESESHEKRSATQVVWQLEVPAKGSVTLDYRFRVAP
ncbi:MAG: DUF4139 domain-containing protein [Pseudomonadota bacterium]